MIKIFSILLMFFFASLLFSKEFISIKEVTNKANLRKGPGNWYPVKWIIETPGLPLKLLEESDNYDKVELHDGTRGWLSKILTSKVTNLIVINDSFLVNRSGVIKAKILKNNIIKEHNCNLKKLPDYCKVRINNIKGFINKSFLWGFAR